MLPVFWEESNSLFGARIRPKPNLDPGTAVKRYGTGNCGGEYGAGAQASAERERERLYI